MNRNQKTIFDNIARATGLATEAETIQVEQTPSYLKEPVQVADFAAGVVSALGASVAELGEARGLPSQEIAVDRRLAALSLNDAAFHYINGVMILGGEIEVPVNSFFEARDGQWLCFNGAYPHLRDGILKYFDAPHDQERLIEKVAQHDSAKILEDFEALNLCAAPLLTHEQWLAHPQGEAMGKLPVVQLEQFGSAKSRVLPESKHRPLEGVRVIDVTHVVAGPWSTRVLADHGADVISIRNPLFPFLYPVIFEESYGKKQVYMHFAIEAQKKRFAELIKTADVLVWGYGPGSLDRLGFTRNKLMELNPNLVKVQVSAYGPVGPWSKRKGWEQLSQTCSGMVDLASRGRDQHHLVAALPLDYGTGYLAAIGAINALRQRQEQGGYWEVEAMLTRTAMDLLSLPHEAEAGAVATSQKDDAKYLVDQDSNFGAVFTKLAPPVRLSKTPAYSALGPAILGAHDPFTTGWDESPRGDGVVTHRPSKIAERGIIGFMETFGHEDIMLRKT